MKIVYVGVNSEDNKAYRCITEDISENKDEYRIRCKEFNAVLFIAKDTKQGMDIASLLKEGLRCTIDDLVMDIILPYLTVEDVLQLLSDKYDKAFEAGRCEAIRNVRKALELPLSF